MRGAMWGMGIMLVVICLATLALAQTAGRAGSIYGVRPYVP